MQQEEKKQVATTDDLSKDMIFEGDEYKNQEGESQSTASEGELKKVDENQQSDEADTTKNTGEQAKDQTTTNDDPTHIPSLKEDESMDKEQG